MARNPYSDHLFLVRELRTPNEQRQRDNKYSTEIDQKGLGKSGSGKHCYIGDVEGKRLQR